MSSPFGNPGSDPRVDAGSFETSGSFEASGFDSFATSDSGMPFGFEDPGLEPQPSGPAHRFVMKSVSWIYCGLALGSAIVAVLIALWAFVGIGNATEKGFMVCSVIAWLLSGIVSFILVGLHKAAENRRRTEGVYLQKYSQVIAIRATFVVGTLGVIISAIEISLWVSKAVGV